MNAWERFRSLVVDNSSAGGRIVTSIVVVVSAIVVAALVGRVLGRRSGDAYRRYYVRKLGRATVWAMAVIVLVVVWRPFAGRAGVVLGFMAAGLAFAMQEVIGALAGWVNIVSGRIFRVGDRVEMGGVQGDVIDITPLRTKIMEIGGDDAAVWVRGRQFTGRVVAVSNKATFTEPVYNYSASFDYLWEEVTTPVGYDADWRRAATILEEEAVRVSSTGEAETAIEQMMRTYPIPRTEVEPRVYVTATDNYVELTARFVVPVRAARAVKDDLTRHILDRLDAAGIAIASTTQDVTVRGWTPRPDAASS